MEIMTLLTDLVLNARPRDKDFWILENKERYPQLCTYTFKVKAYFGFTYVCETSFSQIKTEKLSMN